MKKVFAFVAFATVMLIAGKASAQLSVNGGFLANSNASSTKFTNVVTNKEEKIDTTENAGVGIYAGVSYNIDFTEHWGVAPGVYINYVGKNKKQKIAGTTGNEILDMVDVNIPILFNYKRDFTDSFGIFGFVGPNFRYGISAKYTFKYEDNSEPFKLDYYKKYDGAKNSALSRVDLGLMLGVGVHFNAFRIQTGINIGLLDRDPSKNTTTHFHQYFVGVGYAF